MTAIRLQKIFADFISIIICCKMVLCYFYRMQKNIGLRTLRTTDVFPLPAGRSQESPYLLIQLTRTLFSSSP